MEIGTIDTVVETLVAYKCGMQSDKVSCLQNVINMSILMFTDIQ